MEKIITNIEHYKDYNIGGVKTIYEIWANEHSPDSDTVSFTDWLEMQYIQPKKYKWVCSSDDGYGFFEDSVVDNNDAFDTQEEAYDSMKNSAIDRASWYAEYNEVVEDCDSFDNETTKLTETPDDMGVHCNLEFHPHKIILDRNGCIYEYHIERIGG